MVATHITDHQLKVKVSRKYPTIAKTPPLIYYHLLVWTRCYQKIKLKMKILTRVWNEQHPKAGQNIQHPSYILKVASTYYQFILPQTFYFSKVQCFLSTLNSLFKRICLNLVSQHYRPHLKILCKRK